MPITIGIFEQLVKGLTDGDYLMQYDVEENSLYVSCDGDFGTKILNYIKNLIPSLKIIKTEILPENCIGCQFLESNANKYITTPLKLNSNFELEMDFFWEKDGVDTWSAIFGTQQNNFFIHRNNGQIRIDLQQKENKISGFKASDGKNHISIKNRTASINYQNYINLPTLGTNETLTNANLFHVSGLLTSYVSKMKVYKMSAYDGHSTRVNYKPVINLTTGIACMYDFESESFSSTSGSGVFIAGLSTIQAKKLKKLPSLTSSLSISLPTNYTEDQEVLSALDTARNKGWTLTIQTYDENSTSSASTFGMRRIWVRKSQDENGTYVDADGNRFQVEWCVEIYSPDNTTPEDHGYEQFRSVEAAVEYWNLIPYIDPTLEEQFNSNEQEQ